MSSWLAPAVGYAVALGALGVVTKLSLRTLAWQELVVWAAICYAVTAVSLVVLRGVRLHLTTDGAFAALAGSIAVAGLALIFIALGRGDVSQVIPVTSSYPLLTLVFSFVFLSEQITLPRTIGTGLIVIGVILLIR